MQDSGAVAARRTQEPGPVPCEGRGDVCVASANETGTPGPGGSLVLKVERRPRRRKAFGFGSTRGVQGTGVCRLLCVVEPTRDRTGAAPVPRGTGHVRVETEDEGIWVQARGRCGPHFCRLFICNDLFNVIHVNRVNEKIRFHHRHRRHS